MFRWRLFLHLRFVLVLSMGLIFGGLIGGFCYLSSSGLNGEWRDRIALELENLGIIADFESLRYDPTRGLVATGVRVYADESREDVVAQLEHLVIDVDKTKLMRGKIRVNKVALKKANISLPLDPDDPDGPRVIMNELRGDLLFPDKRTVEARKISGIVAGIQLNLDAHIWSEHLDAPQQPKPLKDVRVARIKLIARIIQKINEWHWPEGKPPRLDLYLEGNIDNPDSARLDFILEAEELEHSGVVLRNVKIKGDYKNKLVTLDQISLEDGSGKIDARADFSPTLRKGRFEADSTLHVQMLARQLFGSVIMNQLTFSTPPSIQCTGTVSFDEDFAPNVQLTGHTTIDDFSCLGSRFKHLKTDFSSQGSASQGTDVFLTGLHVTHEQGGEIKGRILLKNEIIRYEADSTLPASAYAPFLLDSNIERSLKNATFSPSSKIHVTSQGTMNRNDLTKWVATGHAEIENFTYKGTALHSLSGNYELSGLHSRFSDIRANLNYRNYVLRKKHGGPSSARVNVDSITVDIRKHLVRLTNVRGTVWPAPIVRLFVQNVADHVEEYRFHRPPSLSASGTFDLRKTREQTDFHINVSSPGSMNYDFLAKPLTLRQVKAKVRIRGDRVNVSNLSYRTFQGPCSGSLTVHTAKRGHVKYTGEMQWSKLHLKDIGALYEFNNTDQGLLTGRIDFSGENDAMSKFNGKGYLGLEKGNLFSIPMLGPLSPLVGVVLGKKNSANATAKDASCSYVIKNGVILSNDFLATTRALKFTGEGSINLNKKKIDLLVRMNARGLLSVFALPLRPFIGLFQFKGTGDVMNPKWRVTMFTRPERGKKDPIFRKPPKAEEIKE